jgi:FlaG/FlaF family flagellin (archaellin)
MVAITVILAAVIGAFVLEIGDQQETAPNTSFDVEQKNNFYKECCTNRGNFTLVQLTHAGGDAISYSSYDYVIEGNDSAWGPVPQRAGWQGTADGTKPGGGNWRHAEFPEHGIQEPGSSKTLASGEGHVLWGYGSNGESETSGAGTCVAPLWQSSDFQSIGVGAGGDHCRGGLDAITSGDEVRIIWTASSGGKTQTLFRYTVQ